MTEQNICPTQEELTIKHLNKKLYYTQIVFLLLGTLLVIYNGLSMDSTFQNALLLPLMGFLGCLFTYKIWPMPLILTLLLSFIDLAKGMFSPDAFLSMLLFGLVYFTLTFIGTGICLLFRAGRRTFKTMGLKCKLIAMLFYCLSLLLSIGIICFYDVCNGNPITALYAKNQMQYYLESTYPNDSFSLHNPSYNSFKFSSYSAEVYMHNYDEPRPFTLHYSNGRIWDDYFSLYIQDTANGTRLGYEAAEDIMAFLARQELPVSDVSVSLEVAKGLYDGTPFNSSVIKEPLNITITRFTKEKQTYQEFATWCEDIRIALLDGGYTLGTLTLDSDPHFMANRLSLVLEGEELSMPIEDVKKYPHFIDYGKENNIATDATSEAYEKDGLYKDQFLTHRAKVLLNSSSLPHNYVTVYESVDHLTIQVDWFGERTSIDTFIETCLAIRDILYKDTTLLKNTTLYNLNFTYYWGGTNELYNLSLYDADIENATFNTVLESMLTNDKYSTLY